MRAQEFFNKIFEEMGEIKAKVDLIYDIQVSNFKRINGTIQDHEKRIRKLENFSGRLIGAIIILNVIIALVITIFKVL